MCGQCYRDDADCICEPDSPELTARMLALWPGDPTTPIGPVTREMELALAAKGILPERIRIRPDGTVERVEETKY